MPIPEIKMVFLIKHERMAPELGFNRGWKAVWGGAAIPSASSWRRQSGERLAGTFPETIML